MLPPNYLLPRLSCELPFGVVSATFLCYYQGSQFILQPLSIFHRLQYGLKSIAKRPILQCNRGRFAMSFSLYYTAKGVFLIMEIVSG